MSKRLLLVAALLAWAQLTAPAQAKDVTVVAAGDIACSPDSDPAFNEGAGSPGRCQQVATAQLALGLGPLGDLQYTTGRLAAFQRSYDPSWGRLKAITYPVPGNHEYATSPGAGYYAYFGAAAGEQGRGYYSFDLGSWHLIALNSNCDAVGGCGEGSPQLEWLRKDLAANASECTLAYWHQTRFSSGRHGSDESYTGFWEALYAAGADVVLSAHDHDYERFAPQTPEGQADVSGPRAFVVGTGGASFYDVRKPLPTSEKIVTGTFGVLELTLDEGSYAWRFVSDASEVLDRGQESCR